MFIITLKRNKIIFLQNKLKKYNRKPNCIFNQKKAMCENRDDLSRVGQEILIENGVAMQDLFFFEQSVADRYKKENSEIILTKDSWVRVYINGIEFTTKINAGNLVPENLQGSLPVYNGKTTPSMFSQGSKY